MLSDWHDGRIKLYLADRALEFRRLHADLYAGGEYLPLETAGARSANICAFARAKEAQCCVTVAPRLTTRLAPTGRMPFGKPVWQDTALHVPPKTADAWQNILTGEQLIATNISDGSRVLMLSDILNRFPVALLSAKQE